jgi:hypothetical protein
MAAIGEPRPGEYAPYYERYVSLVRCGDILEVPAKQGAEVRRTLSGVPEERAGFRYAPDKWTIREVVGHWTDAG